MSNSGSGKEENVADNLRGLVKMAWDVSSNISNMEDEIRLCTLRIIIAVVVLYAAMMFAILPTGNFVSDSYIFGVSIRSNFFMIKIIGFLILSIPIFSYIFLFFIKVKKLKYDIESEQDVLNQLLAVTFDVRRSISYEQHQNSILEYIAIDLDLKRINFSVSKKRKNRKDIKNDN